MVVILFMSSTLYCLLEIKIVDIYKLAVKFLFRQDNIWDLNNSNLICLQFYDDFLT